MSAHQRGRGPGVISVTIRPLRFIWRAHRGCPASRPSNRRRFSLSRSDGELTNAFSADVRVPYFDSALRRAEGH
jgi:hypothetical protein